MSCCAQSATAFIISATHFIDVNFFNFFVGPNVLFLDRFLYFPFCVNDETLHLTLRRLNHFFVFFVGCPCSRLRSILSEILRRRKDRRRCLSMQFFDVNYCLYLRNVAHVALMRFLISVVLVGGTRFSDLIISRFHFLSVFLFSCLQLQVPFFMSELMMLWLLRIFVSSGWILSPTLFQYFSCIHTTFSASVLRRKQAIARRLQISR